MNNKIKTIYLHIGVHKTGSSSIQETFYKNVEIVEELGYLYPKKWILNHGFVFFPMFAEHPEKHLSNLRKNRTNEECVAINEENRKNILEELNEFKGEKVVFSGEDISPMPYDKVVKLKEYLNEIMPNAEIKVIICTREISGYATSYVQQRAKAGGKKNAIQTALVNNKIYKPRLEKFIEIFGKNSITSYKFEEAVKHPEGPVGYFMNVIGMSNNDIEKIDIIRTNESVSDKSVDLNKYIDDIFPLITDVGVSEVREARDKVPLNKISGTKFILPVEIQKKIRAENMDDTIWLKEKLGIDYTNEEKYKIPEAMIFDEVYEKEMKMISSQMTPLILNLTYRYFNSKITNEVLDLISRTTFEKLLIYYNDNYNEIINNENLNNLIENKIIENLLLEKRSREIISFAEKIEGNPTYNEADCYREIALLCEKTQQIEAALYFMKIAKDFRPTGEFILKKCSQYENQLIK